jgi:hypothetical protein
MTEDGLPKLSDWGLTIFVSRAKEKVIGPLEYMAS